ncbi:hypothetical protein KPE82_14270 [Acinetobacter baumannii]|uniref:hypothetical protein n=1 Tax=Acinetobacter baumannii TaxID=470 RepID=UPI001C0AC68A|nr:hypothetical protein [Acinetobacter baumannii]MBU3096773.1 hypothetical protein [Acinetobacter baumannii]
MPTYAIRTTVEAVLYKGSSTDVGDVKRWMETGVYTESEIKTQDFRDGYWKTEDFELQVKPGDYVIRTENGEFYGMKGYLFRTLFKPA